MTRRRPVALLTAAILTVLGGSVAAIAASSTPTPTVGMPAGGIFGAASVWDQPVSAAPVAPTSAAMVKDLVAHISDRYGGVAAFNAHSFPNAFYTATTGTPTVDVGFNDCQNKGAEPAGLAAQFAGVPIPADAVPAAGTDSELSVWSPSTDQLWELWEARHTAQGWSACWGGRIDHASTSMGAFPAGYGASASGLAESGGTVELSEIRAGVIDHALTLDIPDTATDYVSPANRTDGGDTDPTAIPEGTRLRLDPTIDVDAIPGLTPIGRIIAHTAQTYGFIVTDSSGAVAVTGESGVEQQAQTGVDPWAALELGVPDYQILQDFPWSDLQALPAGWTATAPTPVTTASSSSPITSTPPPAAPTVTVTAVAPTVTVPGPTVTVTDAHTCTLPCTITR